MLDIKTIEIRIQTLIARREDTTFYDPVLIKDFYTPDNNKNKIVKEALKNLVKSGKYIINGDYIEKKYSIDIMND